jgi:hypothetical protein
MECDPNVRDHLHHAKAALHEAHAAAGSHLRNAMRHMFHAGLAAMDAADARCARYQEQRPGQVRQTATETPPPTT